MHPPLTTPMSRAAQWPRIGSRMDPLRGMIGKGRRAKSRQLLRFLGTSAPLPHARARHQHRRRAARLPAVERPPRILTTLLSEPPRYMLQS